jgi:hypothetical protein
MSTSKSSTPPSRKTSIDRLKKHAPWAVLAMLFAVAVLAGLDGLRKPPETLSDSLRAKRELAVARLQAALDARNAAQRVGLEVRREATKAILEYARDDQNAKASNAKAPQAGERKQVLIEKLKNLREAEPFIVGMYYPAESAQTKSPVVAQAKTAAWLPAEVRIKPLAASKAEDIQNALDEIDKLEPGAKGYSFLGKFVDPDSPLYYVFNVITIGMVAVFAVGGLYLLLLLTAVSGIHIPEIKDVGMFMQRAGGSAAVIAGLATTAGLAAVGSAIAMTGSDNAGSAHHGAAGNSVSAKYDGQIKLTNASFFSDATYNALDTSDKPTTMPPGEIPVNIRAEASWLGATTQLVKSTENMNALSVELHAVADKLKTTGAAPALDLKPLVAQTEQLAEKINKLADGTKELMAVNTEANRRINTLAAQALVSDCDARRSAKMLWDSTVHVGETIDATSARMRSGDCVIQQKGMAANPGR